MMDWQIARPMPTPPDLVVKKLSKTRPRASLAIPGPESRTESSTESLSTAATETLIRRSVPSPCEIACMLFTSRLTITC